MMMRLLVRLNFAFIPFNLHYITIYYIRGSSRAKMIKSWDGIQEISSTFDVTRDHVKRLWITFWHSSESQEFTGGNIYWFQISFSYGGLIISIFSLVFLKHFSMNPWNSEKCHQIGRKIWINRKCLHDLLLYAIEEISFMNDVDESDWDFFSEK